MNNWNVFRMFSKSNYSSPNGTNQPSAQESRDLESNVALLKEYDDRRSKVCKELKKMNDCLDELNCSERQLLEELSSATTSDFDKLNRIVEKLSTFMNEISKNREDLSTIINRTSIEPLKKFQNAFNEFKSAIKRHEQLICDSNKFSQKVSKYKDMERTSNVIIKLNDYQSKLTQSQNDLETLRSVLERELPTLLRYRIDYFQPSLASFISSEILYSGNNLSAMNDLKQISDELTDAERNDKQNKLFESIDNLYIMVQNKS